MSVIQIKLKIHGSIKFNINTINIKKIEYVIKINPRILSINIIMKQKCHVELGDLKSFSI